MSSENRRKLLSWTVVGLFAQQGIGTVVAVVYRLPYEVGGIGDPNAVARDFFLGGGTALSAPLVALVILGLLLLAARRQDRWGSIALGTTALLAAVMFTYGVQEPLVTRTLRTAPLGWFTLAVVIIGWGGILLILGLIVLCVLELVQRSKAGRRLNA